MSYGLNVEMHKQVRSALFTLLFAYVVYLFTLTVDPPFETEVEVEVLRADTGWFR